MEKLAEHTDLLRKHERSINNSNSIKQRPMKKQFLGAAVLLVMALGCSLQSKASNDTVYYKNGAIRFIINKGDNGTNTFVQLNGEGGENLMKPGRWSYNYFDSRQIQHGYTIQDNTVADAYWIRQRNGKADTVFTTITYSQEQQQQLADATASLYANLKYPFKAKENGVNGTVYVSFVVNSDGKISELEPMTKLGYGLEEAAVDAAKQLKFTPVAYNGRIVSMYFELPVKFLLQQQ
ncbi:TonB family C-terminal domain-containing protein [Chitinophaga rupis]|uniref:TonB family C-terminal domain-containing protein n=2 Tax=Chitinophaga rupis TaxID=573321 RepID=A0A1H7SDZ6_9BACT|nr:TonB family C-terminal domain-containing protein [Chitinophaga rupis]